MITDSWYFESFSARTVRLPIMVTRRSSGRHASGFGGAAGLADPLAVGVGEPLGLAELLVVGLGEGDGLGDVDEPAEGVGAAEGVGPADCFELADGDGIGAGEVSVGGTAVVGSGLPRARTAATMIVNTTARTATTNARRTQ